MILSRAVKNEPQLRDFLKEEALLEFDNDYDVFYPWTKGKEVINDKTFGDIIEEYDYEGKLQNILKAVPKTTCSFSFIPIDIRNEYEITQCLRNRKPAQS